MTCKVPPNNPYAPPSHSTARADWRPELAWNLNTFGFKSLQDAHARCRRRQLDFIPFYPSYVRLLPGKGAFDQGGDRQL